MSFNNDIKKLSLPHLPPILFATNIESKVDSTANVNISFKSIPSFPMLIEASAQATASFNDSSKNVEGFLVTLKNVKLLKKPEDLNYIVKVSLEQQLGLLQYFSFEVYDSIDTIAKGNLAIAIK